MMQLKEGTTTLEESFSSLQKVCLNLLEQRNELLESCKEAEKYIGIMIFNHVDLSTATKKLKKQIEEVIAKATGGQDAA